MPATSNDSICSLLQSAIDAAHDKIDRLNMPHSGTTCVAVVLTHERDESRMIIANVGDSAAVIGMHDGSAWTARKLTKVHARGVFLCLWSRGGMQQHDVLTVLSCLVSSLYPLSLSLSLSLSLFES